MSTLSSGGVAGGLLLWGCIFGGGGRGGESSFSLLAREHVASGSIPNGRGSALAQSPHKILRFS